MIIAYWKRYINPAWAGRESEVNMMENKPINIAFNFEIEEFENLQRLIVEHEKITKALSDNTEEIYYAKLKLTAKVNHPFANSND